MDINSDRNRLTDKYEIKVENSDEDINEYAESTMNELLGWYGYENRRKGKPKMIPYCSQNGSTSSGPDSPKYSGSCDWCSHVVDDNKAISSAGAVFCSELCFSQSRRANFKKNKTCDWCRHVRHTISYVDFQDGASQLQFCSDKCLNQYKMHIFCRETKAHLKMHPHVPENAKSSGVLITPDLWLRDSRQDDALSASPPPWITKDDVQTSPLPLISLVHPSKLIEQKTENGTFHSSSKRQKSATTQKKKRKRTLPDNSCTTSPDSKSLWNDCPQDLRIKQPYIHKSTNNLEETQPPHQSTNSKLFYDKISETFDNKSQTSIIPRSTTLPPVTVLVPYPIFVPVPLPIPIPFDSKLLIPNKEPPKNNNYDKELPKTDGKTIIDDNDKLLNLSSCNNYNNKSPDKKDLLEDGCEQTIIRNLNVEELLEEKNGFSSPATAKECPQKPQNLRLRSLKKRKKILEVKRKSLQLRAKRTTVST
ncbi:sine oculis-binding protein homolog [Agrilus planipennis]|uniref:Sine oculis-binding protein homolog n=1 Tax=Agrilus planipennis TaxID=224129 RepID=A0A1W4WQE9_AGRPL|nr:sine oculis-binding protein homolog [Agrilus planipennis]